MIDSWWLFCMPPDERMVRNDAAGTLSISGMGSLTVSYSGLVTLMGIGASYEKLASITFTS